MKKLVLGAALAVAAMFVALAPAALVQAQTVTDAAAYQIDEAYVHQGAVELVAPAADSARLHETRLTAYAPDGRVDVPWGDWLSEALKALLALAGALALWLLRRLPSTMVSALDMFAGMMGQGRANELLEKAVAYGVNVTAGAVKGKTLKVEVGNEVMERALEYALRHAPQLVAKLGGIAVIREKIIARLDLDENAAIPSPRPPAERLIQQAVSTPSPAAQ